MKLGDLVKQKTWTVNGCERLALVVETHFGYSGAKVFYMDTGEIKSALKKNLEVINESR